LKERKSVDASDFADDLQELHEQVKRRLQQSNSKYKRREDMQRRMKVFEEGELVMAHLQKEIFPNGTYSKLKYKKIGPCKILRKISENAYKLELPEELDISLIFNVAYLYEFHKGEESDEIGMLDEWK
jgi:hypothetical protein